MLLHKNKRNRHAQSNTGLERLVPSNQQCVSLSLLYSASMLAFRPLCLLSHVYMQIALELFLATISSFKKEFFEFLMNGGYFISMKIGCHTHNNNNETFK